MAMNDDAPFQLHPHVILRTTPDFDDIRILLIVEPDLESWMETPQAMGQAQLICDELNDIGSVDDALIGISTIWLCSEDDGIFVGEGKYADIHIRHELKFDNEQGREFLEDVLKGLKSREPQATVAIIGATREEEIVEAANIVIECGLQAVIIEPMSLSSALFLNLEGLDQESNRRRAARRVLTGEDESFLSDLLDIDENDEDVQSDDDEEDEDEGA